jgi:hypothetical protein
VILTKRIAVLRRSRVPEDQNYRRKAVIRPKETDRRLANATVRSKLTKNETKRANLKKKV